MMLDNGLKLQVKCGRLRHHKGYKAGAYSFDVRKAFTIVGSTVFKHQKERTYVGTCDFIIFWAIDENRFFVIPSTSISGAVWIPSKECLMMNRKIVTVARTIVACEEAWHLLDVDGVAEETVEEIEQEVING